MWSCQTPSSLCGFCRSRSAHRLYTCSMLPTVDNLMHHTIRFCRDSAAQSTHICFTCQHLQASSIWNLTGNTCWHYSVQGLSKSQLFRKISSEHQYGNALWQVAEDEKALKRMHSGSRAHSGSGLGREEIQQENGAQDLIRRSLPEGTTFSRWTHTSL